MKKDLEYIIELVWKSKSINELNKQQILDAINKLFTKYNFEDIPAYIYKLQIDIFLSENNIDKAYNTLDFVKPMFKLQNIEYYNNNIAEVFNRIFLYSTYLKVLFIKWDDIEFQKNIDNFFNIVVIYKDYFADNLQPDAIISLNININFLHCVNLILNYKLDPEFMKSKEMDNFKIANYIIWNIYPNILYNRIEQRYSYLLVHIMKEYLFENNIEPIIEIYNEYKTKHNIESDIPLYLNKII